MLAPRQYLLLIGLLQADRSTFGELSLELIIGADKMLFAGQKPKIEIFGSEVAKLQKRIEKLGAFAGQLFDYQQKLKEVAAGKTAAGKKAEELFPKLTE